jgi:hypothetical protein
MPGISIATLLLAAFIPQLVFAAPDTFTKLVALVVLIINVATPSLIALALVLFLVRVLMSMTGAGEGKEKGASYARLKEIMLWGIGIIFVMVSIWGILNLIDNTFMSGDSGFIGSGEIDPCDSLDAVGC